MGLYVREGPQPSGGTLQLRDRQSTVDCPTRILYSVPDAVATVPFARGEIFVGNEIAIAWPRAVGRI